MDDDADREEALAFEAEAQFWTQADRAKRAEMSRNDAHPDQVTCPWCHGRGSIPVESGSTTRYRCADCKGTGMVTEPHD